MRKRILDSNLRRREEKRGNSKGVELTAKGVKISGFSTQARRQNTSRLCRENLEAAARLPALVALLANRHADQLR